jgi:hypothetical protein
MRSRRSIAVLSVLALLFNVSGLVMAKAMPVEQAPSQAAQPHCADADPAERSAVCCADGACHCVLHLLPMRFEQPRATLGEIGAPQLPSTTAALARPFDDPLRPPIH